MYHIALDFNSLKEVISQVTLNSFFQSKSTQQSISLLKCGHTYRQPAQPINKCTGQQNELYKIHTNLLKEWYKSGMALTIVY